MNSCKLVFPFMLTLIILPLCVGGQHEIDFQKLYSRVESIDFKEDHKAFWEEIHKSDQSNAKTKGLNNQKINEINLFLTALYLNKFGYPEENICGKKGNIARIVWAHCNSTPIAKYTFPIILEGFLKGSISKEDLLDYFLKIHIWEEHGSFETDLPLKELFDTLALNLDTINLDSLIIMINDLNKFKNAKVKCLYQWTKERAAYSLYKHKNGLFYFVRTDVGHEARQVIFLDIDKRIFAYKYIHKDWHYEIDKTGDLLVYKSDLQIEPDEKYYLVIQD